MNIDLIKKLAEKRQKLEELKNERDSMIAKVSESPTYQALNTKIQELSQQLDETGADIRKIALDEYAADQNKKPGNGIEIKIFSVATILDPEHAREWCLTNFRPALKLDEAMLRKTAIEGAIPSSVVSVTQEPRAQIASDLSEFLPDPLICQVTGKLKTECTGGDCDCIPF